MYGGVWDVRSCPRVVRGLAGCCSELLRVEAGEVWSGSHHVNLDWYER